MSVDESLPKKWFTQLAANSVDETKIKVKNFLIPDANQPRPKLLNNEDFGTSFKVISSMRKRDEKAVEKAENVADKMLFRIEKVSTPSRKLEPTGIVTTRQFLS